MRTIAITVLFTLAAGVSAAQSPDEALREEIRRLDPDPKAIRALIGRGANPNAVAPDGKTPLIAVVDEVGGANLQVLRVLLSAGAQPNRRAGLTTALCEAITNNSSAPIDKDNAVLLLLRHGADPNLSCERSEPPLREAILYHSETVVAMLIAAGARVNDVDADGRPLIIEAAIYGPTSLVRRFIDAGADVNARGRRGETALSSAKNPRIVKLLRERGARD